MEATERGEQFSVPGTAVRYLSPTFFKKMARPSPHRFLGAEKVQKFPQK